MAARQPYDPKDKFVWSKQQFTMRNIVDKFQSHAPFLLCVVEGYCGRDSTHTIGSDEIYWFEGIVTQARLVCQAKDKFYSIPTTCKEPIIPYTSKGKAGREMTIQEMVKDISYKSFHFAADASHSVYSGADSSSSLELGMLTIIDEYLEKFLATFTCTMERRGLPLHRHLTLIPVYMPIDVAIATAMTKRSERTFLKTMLEYHSLAKSFDLQRQLPKALMRPEVSKIMAFEENPLSDYEYIELVSIELAKGNLTASNTHDVERQLLADEEDDYEILDDNHLKKMSEMARLMKLLEMIQNVIDTNSVPNGESSEEEDDRPVIPPRKLSLSTQQSEPEPRDHLMPPLPPRKPLDKTTPLPFSEERDVKEKGAGKLSLKPKPFSEEKDVKRDCNLQRFESKPVTKETISVAKPFKYKPMYLDPNVPTRPERTRDEREAKSDTSRQGKDISVTGPREIVNREPSTKHTPSSPGQPSTSVNLSNQSLVKSAHSYTKSTTKSTVSEKEQETCLQNLHRQGIREPVKDDSNHGRKPCLILRAENQSECQSTFDGKMQHVNTNQEKLTSKPATIQMVLPTNNETSFDQEKDTAKDKPKKIPPQVAKKTYKVQLRDKHDETLNQSLKEVTTTSAQHPLSQSKAPQAVVRPTCHPSPQRFTKIIEESKRSSILKVSIEEDGKESKTEPLKPFDFSNVRSIKDIPKDMDIVELNVEDICKCLELLRMNDHVEAFTELQIDGQMLLWLSEDILQNEFRFTAINAIKLMRFAKSGWRPS